MTEPFDLIAERYDESFQDRTGQLAAGRWLLDELPRPARVLDLGCGSGLPTARQLTAGGLAVVGVDSSARMLDLARRNAPDAEYHLGDLRAVPDAVGEIDAVAAFFSLLMLPRAAFTPTLAGLRDRLRGPRLLALGMVDGDLDDVPVDFLGVPVRVSALPAGALRAAVEAAGFTVRALHRRTTALGDTTETHLFLYASA
ncbi:class I SAM-dependent DNA methyltransferase [Actinocatenispora rupis]|uniref:Methyltransferase n=1 Tax=Actinocatenispora rupis TaxID=519421 RepID=A0A8J3IXY2_9ACTN|nr:class I SAM-dependent methyltransferase [Actinocatenispora rupis]GID12101.1 methyltransferase [Actinocatenispora rupis]